MDPKDRVETLIKTKASSIHKRIAGNDSPAGAGYQVPIILCTAATRVVQDKVMAEQLRQLRVRVVLKPFDINELLAVLGEALMASRGESARDPPARTVQ